MGKRTSRFLSISLALISLFCILIFVGQAAYINYLGENALRQLGVFYMSGISQLFQGLSACTAGGIGDPRRGALVPCGDRSAPTEAEA